MKAWLVRIMISAGARITLEEARYWRSNRSEACSREVLAQLETAAAFLKARCGGKVRVQATTRFLSYFPSTGSGAARAAPGLRR